MDLGEKRDKSGGGENCSGDAIYEKRINKLYIKKNHLTIYLKYTFFLGHTINFFFKIKDYLQRDVKGCSQLNAVICLRMVKTCLGLKKIIVSIIRFLLFWKKTTTCHF